jgi:protein phosphatase slingshot
MLQGAGVTHIINTAQGSTDKYCLHYTHSDDISYMSCYLKDVEGQSIAQEFDRTFAFIEEAHAANGKVLVHCVQGKSRSTSIVIAYLLRKRGMSLDDALALVKARRPIARPNAGFMKQLKIFENTLQAEKAESSISNADDHLHAK